MVVVWHISGDLSSPFRGDYSNSNYDYDFGRHGGHPSIMLNRVFLRTGGLGAVPTPLCVVFTDRDGALD